MERETFVGIDVGTTKVVALIGEVGRDGGLTIIGKGIVPASGLRKGNVVNIDETRHSISAAVEKAERHAGYKIERAFVGVGGQHVEGINSPGQVAVAGPRREVTQEDVNRSIEVARAVSIPSTREVLHVIPRGYTVDGQEGVMNPLGMSAVRLEVSTHIVTASATAVQNLTKCVTADGALINRIIADPASFYVNVHTAEFPAGAVRGQVAARSSETQFNPVPVRVYDSRALAAGKIKVDETRQVDLQLPAGVRAGIITVTVTETEMGVFGGFLTVYAGGVSAVPNSSTVNWTTSDTSVATTTFAAVDENGRISITAGQNATHVIVDVIGFVI